jgi:cyclin H
MAATATDAAPPSEQKVPLYEGGTQFKNWRYSVEQLAHTRTILNEAAVSAIRSTFENDEVLQLRLLLIPLA